VRAHGTPQQVVKRCRIVLLAHQGQTDLEIAEELGVNRHTVSAVAGTIHGRGARGSVGSGTRPRTQARARSGRGRVVKATFGEQGRMGQTHWKQRGTMAEEQGVDQSTVHRIWQEHGLAAAIGRRLSSSRERPRIRTEAPGCGGGCT